MSSETDQLIKHLYVVLLPSEHIKLFGAGFGSNRHSQLLAQLAIVADARVTATRAITDSGKDMISKTRETKIENGKIYVSRPRWTDNQENNARRKTYWHINPRQTDREKSSKLKQTKREILVGRCTEAPWANLKKRQQNCLVLLHKANKVLFAQMVMLFPHCWYLCLLSVKKVNLFSNREKFCRL